MDNETHEYIKTLNRKTLVEIIDSLSFAAGFEIHHGDDPGTGEHTVYGVHLQDGSFTLAHINPSSFEETMSNNTNTTDNGCGCMQDPPCIGCNKPSEKYRGFYATIQYYDEDETKYVFICNSQDMEEDDENDGHVFYYYDGTPEQFMKDFSKERGRGCADWYAHAVEGVSPPSEPNRLHLFKVYTIDDDLSESDPVFVMARSEDGAACLFHKARARDQDNILCEVIVSKVQDAEVCDE
jgi:hypothetical protein